MMALAGYQQALLPHGQELELEKKKFKNESNGSIWINWKVEWKQIDPEYEYLIPQMSLGEVQIVDNQIKWKVLYFQARKLDDFDFSIAGDAPVELFEQSLFFRSGPGGLLEVEDQ